MKSKHILLLAILLVPSVAFAALRVDGEVVHPTPAQLLGATIVADVAISRIEKPEPVLISRAELSGSVVAAPITATAYPPDMELFREHQVKIPVGRVQHLQPGGLIAAQPLIQEHPVRLGVSLASRFAVHDGAFAGQVRGEILSQTGTENIQFDGHDYPVPTVRKVVFEHDVVLGTNRFTVDGMVVEIEVSAVPGTLASAR